MSKCHLIWGEDGHLVCTVLHHDYKNCDLNNLEDSL